MRASPPRRVLLGLIGAGIGESLAPTLHEDALAAAGLEGHYHLMDLAALGSRAGLAALIAAVRACGFAGVNVTHPVKEAVIPLLDEVDAEASDIGAVNTVVVAAGGRLRGHNTDRPGFRRAFEETLGRDAVAARTAVLVGAGGAGKAVAWALADLGVGRLFIHDRDPARAAALAAELGARLAGREIVAADDLAAAIDGAAGLINATPVGMLGHEGMPVPAALLAARLWVADVIYTPLETALISAARAAGCRVMTGGGMCVHQAADAFRLFTGLVPDAGRMDRVFRAACARRDAALAAAGRIARREGVTA